MSQFYIICHNITSYVTIQYHMSQYNTICHNIIPYVTILYNMPQYNIICPNMISQTPLTLLQYLPECWHYKRVEYWKNWSISGGNKKEYLWAVRLEFYLIITYSYILPDLLPDVWVFLYSTWSLHVLKSYQIFTHSYNLPDL